MARAMLIPAFTDPVSASQGVFRTALSALSEPGGEHSVPHELTLDGLNAASYALCLSLLDNDTPVWLSAALDTAAVRSNLTFHCGCPLVTDRTQASFALLTADDLNDLTGFKAGTDRDPDQSCTLLVQLPALSQGPATTWQGPGIWRDRTVCLPVHGGFWKQREAHRFPQGLDVFFTAENRLMGLARSTRVLPTNQEGN